jgi:hypothetical protein
VYKRGPNNLCADALSCRACKTPAIDAGVDLDFITHISEQPTVAENGKIKRKNKTLQLITFEDRTVKSIAATNKIGQDETKNKENIETKPSLNSITQTDTVPLDTIMGGKYDIKLLQAEDSDFKNIVAYLKDGILDPDNAKARKTII